MIDAEANSARRRAQRRHLSPPDPNHPLPMWPMAHIYAEQGEILATENEKATAGDGQVRFVVTGAGTRACSYPASPGKITSVNSYAQTRR